MLKGYAALPACTAQKALSSGRNWSWLSICYSYTLFLLETLIQKWPSYAGCNTKYAKILKGIFLDSVQKNLKNYN